MEPRPRYSLPAAAPYERRRENPLHLPIFSHVPSIVRNLLHSHYFLPHDWDRWFELYELSARHSVTCDLFRNVEYLYAEKELSLQPGIRVLDIGTGQSVFPCYLRRRTNASFVVVDLDNYGFGTQRTYFRDSGYNPPWMVQGDATRLPFLPESFQRVLAVSAIEHFPNQGDTRFMAAAWQALAPGGKCIVTVPYADTFQENLQVPHYHGGFERRYTREALKERLWDAAPWHVERELYLNPGDTPLARRLIARHGGLNHFFGAWYSTRANLHHSNDSLWYTLLLIDLADRPAPGCFGACVTLRRPEA